MGKVGEFGLSTYSNQTEEENTKRVSESKLVDTKRRTSLGQNQFIENYRQ